MTRGIVDIEKLRVALRRMSRGNLLMVAERAIDIVPRAKLSVLVGDMVRLDQLAEGKRGAAPLLDEVRKFHDASRRGEYYDSFDVNSKDFMDKSEGTEAFIAEFDRLILKCGRAAAKGPHAPVRTTACPTARSRSSRRPSRRLTRAGRTRSAARSGTRPTAA